MIVEENNDTPTIQNNDTPTIQNNDTPTIQNNDTPTIQNNDTPTIQNNDTTIEEQPQSEWNKDFKTSDDLYKAYTTLKEQQSQKLDFNKYVDEYKKNTKLSDESYQNLQEKGLSSDVIETFIKGQIAQQTLMENDVKSTIGKDNYDKMTSWASNNLSKEEIDSYNQMVSTSDVNQAKLAVQGLYQRYQSNTTPASTIIAGNTNNSTQPKTYRSSAEVIADMKTDKYKTDPAFRNEVAERLKEFTY